MAPHAQRPSPCLIWTCDRISNSNVGPWTPEFPLELGLATSQIMATPLRGCFSLLLCCQTSHGQRGKWNLLPSSASITCCFLCPCISWTVSKHRNNYNPIKENPPLLKTLQFLISFRVRLEGDLTKLSGPHDSSPPAPPNLVLLLSSWTPWSLAILQPWGTRWFLNLPGTITPLRTHRLLSPPPERLFPQIFTTWF